MPTIAETVTQLAGDLGDPDAVVWSAEDLTRAVTHALQDLAVRGIGNSSALDHVGDGTARVKISDHSTVHHVMAVEYPVNADPQKYVDFHLESDGTDTWIVLHTTALPTASDSVRIHSIATIADVPHRAVAAVLAGGALYALEMEAARRAATLNVDPWVVNRYRDQADRKRASYQVLLAELAPWTPPAGKGAYRANWPEID